MINRIKRILDILWPIMLMSPVVGIIYYGATNKPQSYGPYIVREYMCIAGECRVVLNTGDRITIYRAVTEGDELCYVLQRSSAQWRFCSNTQKAKLEHFPPIELD
jgi:hypothetical protein